MSHPKLNWAMARSALKLAESHELIDAAHAALDNGFYSYSLGELATLYEPSAQRSEQLFVAALKELGLKLPTQDASLELMLELDAVEVFEGRIESYLLLQRLYRECLGFEFSGQQNLGKWIRHYHQLDELRDYDNPDTFNVEFSEVHSEYIERNQRFLQFTRDWILDRNRPFLQPQWLTSTVLGLAASIRDEKAFDRLPILADALQDAGCEREEWLDHLRYTRGHGANCWLIELLSEDGRA